MVETGLHQGPSSGDCHRGPGSLSQPLQKTACSSRQAGLRLWPRVSARLAYLRCRQAQLLTGVPLALGHVEQESPLQQGQYGVKAGCFPPAFQVGGWGFL